MKTAKAILCFAPLVLWSAFQASPSQDPVRGYRRWQRVTPQPLASTPACSPAPSDSPRSFVVYVNPAGKSSMATRSTPHFPTGSTIVKELYDPARVRAGRPLPEPDLLLVMQKGAPRSKPAWGDWSFSAAGRAADVAVGADATACVRCHAQQKSTDFVFRTYARPAPGGK